MLIAQIELLLNPNTFHAQMVLNALVVIPPMNVQWVHQELHAYGHLIMFH
jgi:hypothetical protein